MKRKRVLAVASGGGHWVQLRRLFDAFEDCDLALATVHSNYEADAPAGARFYTIRDASRWNKLALLYLAFQVFRIVVMERPHVVVSTGAAPGYLSLRIGKLLGARTIWIDSIANVEHMSLSGRMIKPYADVWLTQWEHLSSPEGPRFIGSVI